MRQSPGFFAALRSAGFLVISIFGLASIIATQGGDGGRKTDPSINEESSLNYPGIDEQYRKDTGIYYRDADGDSYGDPNDYASFETQPIGYYVTQGNDCDDTNYDIHPMAEEICGDGLDNNCDGVVDAGCAYTCTDADRDGYYAQDECKGKPDCNDASAAVNPDAVERCWDGVDNNCNGQIDEGDCVFAGTDVDGDGYYADTGDNELVDCDDANANINPGAVDYCGDSIDNNCNGQIDEGCPLLPDTGQGACYNISGQAIRCPEPGYTFSGQDGMYTINPPSYTRLDADGNEMYESGTGGECAMIRDNNTGLLWENKTYVDGIRESDDRYSWFDASDVFIRRLNNEVFAGYDDWRLPTKKELVNLVHFGKRSPAISGLFPWTVSACYWSSTSNACGAYHAWYVDFEYGRDYSARKNMWKFVRAVRGAQSFPMFTENDDGTIIDQETGLMWAQGTTDVDEDGVIAFADAMTWQQALSWCENLTLFGYSDWRLPNLKELVSIVDNDVADPAIDTTFFPDTMSVEYWSSTTANDEFEDYALAVNFMCGEYVNGKKTNKYYVRAVRGGM